MGAKDKIIIPIMRMGGMGKTMFIQHVDITHVKEFMGTFEMSKEEVEKRIKQWFPKIN